MLPALGMGVLIAAFRLFEHFSGNGAELVSNEVYQIVRTVLISGLMASTIAWLAFSYRRGYEVQLKERNEDLQATRDFLAAIIEGSGEAIITLDRQGRVTSWNNAAQTIYGWTAEEMMGRDLSRLMPPDPKLADQERHYDQWVLDGRTLRHYETERLHKDGRRIVVHLTRSPLYDSIGNYLGSTVILHDVTNLKQLQEQLREKEYLAAVGQMSATVAHEIKNPLAGIRSACEIIHGALPTSGDERELSDEVLRQVERLDHTVHDLLEFARPRPKQAVPTDLHEMSDRVIGLLTEDPANGRVEVRREYDADLPLVQVDPQQMEQVLLNLLLNAFQAVDHKGRVTVRTGHDPARLRIEIEDDGPGIHEDLGDRIFDPFFTTRTRGTGLGLAIVRKIVRAHEGEIRYQPADGGGTSFIVSLPYRS